MSLRTSLFRLVKQSRFSPKGCHCEVVCSFPKQSLSFSLVPESFILKTLHEKGESPNKKGKGRKNKRMVTHPSSLIGKLQTQHNTNTTLHSTTVSIPPTEATNQREPGRRMGEGLSVSIPHREATNLNLRNMSFSCLDGFNPS